jgi:enoyl-CoA hydratase/carnithine racemase
MLVISRTKRKVLRWIGKRQLTNAAPHALCVLTGAGGAFCAGADLKAMARAHPGEQRRDR